MQGVKLKKQQTIESKGEKGTVDNLIKKWKFFLPKIDSVQRILSLNERIGDEYFQKEYKNLLRKEGDFSESEKDVQFEENLKNPSWHKMLFDRISQIMFHYESEEGQRHSAMSDEEFLSFSRKHISERIYNHLAMLARSPHTAKGKSFSLREELTEELAEKIGLGMYLTDNISAKLKVEVQNVLYELAEDFEQWFVDEKKGRFSTIFGEIYSVEKWSEISSDKKIGNALVLSPDVRQGRTFVAKG